MRLFHGRSDQSLEDPGFNFLKMKNSLFIFCTLFLFSCGEEKKSSGGTPNGKQLYEDNCSICHGGDGKLGVNGAKDLSASTMSMEEALSVIENGKGTMTPFRELMNEEERKEVGKYIQELKIK